MMKRTNTIALFEIELKPRTSRVLDASQTGVSQPSTYPSEECTAKPAKGKTWHSCRGIKTRSKHTILS